MTIKLTEIAKQVIKEGGKAFGTRASRVSTEELHKAFEYLKNKLGNDFSKFEIPRTLSNKETHGDIDIVVINNNGYNIEKYLQQKLNNDVKDFLKNGNVNSALIHIPVIDKDCHVDIITTGNEDDFSPQLNYLQYGDLSGILGVMARRLKYNYGTQGFFKIYEDRRGQYHYILLTKNLKEGLRILGYDDTALKKFDDGLNNEDDVVDFISSSPLFDSDFYRSMNFSHSDRKRVRGGRPSADYVRHKLIDINKSATITDTDVFLKKLYPQYVDKLNKQIHEIENKVVATKTYSGDWILSHFPEIKPGKIVGQIMAYWKTLFNNDIDSQTKETMLKVTQDYINKNKL